MLQFEYLKANFLGAGVLHVQLARGRANAVHREMYLEIRELFGNVDALGEDVRAIVLSGQGKHFCAGNDLDEFATMTPDNAEERMWRVREAFNAIAECSVPVIGAITGAALGTGMAIAACCDFVVAATDAQFGLPELTVGVMGGARHLARLASQPLVRRMYFTGLQMSAEEFADAGASIFVTDRTSVLDEATRHAVRIASHSPTAVRVSKRILDRVEWMELKTGYEHEQGGTCRMSGHADSKEALKAFKEKRPPQYLPRSDDKRWFGT
jgi:enoyl-CoA hydratase